MLDKLLRRQEDTIRNAFPLVTPKQAAELKGGPEESLPLMIIRVLQTFASIHKLF